MIAVAGLVTACFDPESPSLDGTETVGTASSTGEVSGPSTSADSTGGSAEATSSSMTSTTEPGTSSSTTGDTTGLSSSSGEGSSTGVMETCVDGVVNQDETDVDCGGSICDPCEDGQACGGGGDCVSTVCQGGQCIDYCSEGCPVVGSTASSTVYVYAPGTLSQVASFAGVASVQSVEGGTGSLIYAGGSGQGYEIDVATGVVTGLGAGIVSGSLYGTSVGGDGRIYYSGSGMPDVRIIQPDGGDGGIVDVLVGTNLRSTAFGPDGSFYVASFSGNLVERWAPGFIYVGTFNGGGMGSPFGITTRSDGTVIVASQNNAAYYVYTAAGAFLSSTPVACAGQIRNVEVDANDVLYVGCYDANQVVVFSVANVPIDSIMVTSPAAVGMLYDWPGAPP